MKEHIINILKLYYDWNKAIKNCGNEELIDLVYEIYCPSKLFNLALDMCGMPAENSIFDENECTNIIDGESILVFPNDYFCRDFYDWAFEICMEHEDYDLFYDMATNTNHYDNITISSQACDNYKKLKNKQNEH